MIPVEDYVARVGELRRAAEERFSALGFPDRKNEDWKYTNVSRIARAEFAPGDGMARVPAGLDPLAGLDCHRLVFVNGKYRPELSDRGDVYAGSLAQAMGSGDEPAESHLAQYAKLDGQAFVALNTAHLGDGAFVRIPARKALEKPICLLFLSVGERTVSHPRTLVLAGAGSEASIIEVYAGSGAGYFTNAVTELALGEGALVDHYKLEAEVPDAFHIATIQARQERASTYHSHSVSLGGGLVRNDINSVLGGEGGEAILNGLYLGTAEQHIDNHTALDHAMPHCSSREYYRGILSGRASGVFNGKIIVRQDAQKTDAIQSNKNLLLSEHASINTKPQLEIFADDVRCTHGATVGQLDREALFYLRSRGIGREQARNVLTAAFASEVLERVKHAGLRTRLEALVGARLEEL